MRPRRLIFAISVVLSVGAGDGSGELQVRKEGAAVFVQGSQVALSEVLDRLASATGMTVIYDGPPPRQLVTAHIEGRSEVEAVQALFEGQAINYALTLDPSGVHVELLILVTDTTRQGGSSGSRPPVPAETIGAESPADDFDVEAAPVAEPPEGESAIPPGFTPRRMPAPMPEPVVPPGTASPWDIAPEDPSPPAMPSFPKTPSNPAGTVEAPWS